jgi:hypothetical protein
VPEFKTPKTSSDSPATESTATAIAPAAAIIPQTADRAGGDPIVEPALDVADLADPGRDPTG